MFACLFSDVQKFRGNGSVEKTGLLFCIVMFFLPETSCEVYMDSKPHIHNGGSLIASQFLHKIITMPCSSAFMVFVA